MNAEKALENLSRNGFDAKYFETAAQAADYLAAQLHGKTIGFGGSVTRTIRSSGTGSSLRTRPAQPPRTRRSI